MVWVLLSSPVGLVPKYLPFHVLPWGIWAAARLAPEQMGNLMVHALMPRPPRTLAADSSQRTQLCSLSPKTASLDCRTFLFCLPLPLTTDLHSFLGGGGQHFYFPWEIVRELLVASLTHSFTHLAFLEFQFCAGVKCPGYNLKKTFLPPRSLQFKTYRAKSQDFEARQTLGSDLGSDIYLLATEPDANFLLSLY